MLRLKIKGNIYEARAALDARGIQTVAALDPGVPYNDPKVAEQWYTLADVHDGDHDKVVAWFCEPAGLVPGFGYPAGTLLFYR